MPIFKVSRKEQHPDELVEAIASHYEAILRLIGEDPEREGLRKTPVRAAKALIDNTVGYRQDPKALVRKAIFNHQGRQMVIVKGMEFYSICEHHILPFFGKVAVGYLPEGRIVGLSKLARVVDAYARRLQVQEKLTSQICALLADALPNRGVIVACTAEHLCMKMRGVEKQDSATTTYEYTGEFAADPDLRREFLELIK